MEVPKAVGLALEDFHFGVETFGDSIVTSEAPHGGNLAGPGLKGIAQRDQLRQPGLAELVDGTQQARDKNFALLAGAMLLQKQVTQFLFEAIDELQSWMFGQVDSF